MGCICAVVVLLFAIPVLAQVQRRETICIRIDKVGEAPGFWSGIVAATQWIDATVVASSSKDHKVGDKITFGLYVVQGDKFADRQTPRLNPKLIYAGATLTPDTKASCRTDGSKGWVYTCIKMGCSHAKSNEGTADPPKTQ
jgi:hypothetical protein